MGVAPDFTVVGRRRQRLNGAMEYTVVTPAAFADLPDLDDWQRRGQFLHAAFRAPSYAEGAALVVSIATAADAAVHHPDLELVYPGVVKVALTTHATRSLTTLDIELARTISRLAADSGAHTEPVRPVRSGRRRWVRFGR